MDKMIARDERRGQVRTARSCQRRRTEKGGRHTPLCQRETGATAFGFALDVVWDAGWFCLSGSPEVEQVTPL